MNTILTLTGPSCSGKSRLADQLINMEIVTRVQACTTRPLRAGEVEGVDYFFLSREEYEKMRANGEFFEDVQANGVDYGITKEEISLKLQHNYPPLIIANMIGLNQINKSSSELGYRHVSVFMSTNNKVTLVNRWLNRFKQNPESQKEIAERLFKTITEEINWDSEFPFDLRLYDVKDIEAIQTIQNLIKV